MKSNRSNTFRFLSSVNDRLVPTDVRPVGNRITIAKSGLVLFRTSHWTTILTHDYFPGVNPYIRWIWTPLGTLGLTATAAALCGMILHPQGFVVLVGILSVLAFGLGFPWLSLRGVHGSLSFGRERAREGEPVPVKVSLTNRLPWSAWGLTIEGGFTPNDSVETQASAAGLALLRGWRTTRLTLALVPPCRGDYPIHPSRIATGFPFGLHKAWRSLAVESRLLVWPKTFPVGPIPCSGGRGVEGSSSCAKPGASGDMIGVRPYRRGDSLRRIHWPQTARHDQLIVCEVHSQAIPRIQVVIDSHESVHTGRGPNGSREWAIRIAASYAEDWIKQDAEVELVLQGRVIAATDGSKQRRRARLLDTLAGMDTQDPYRLSDLLDLAACRKFREGIRLIVTTDLGIQTISRRPSPGRSELFVVLRARAFAEKGEQVHHAPLPLTPWILVDDPTRVPQSLLRVRKEVLVDR